MGEVVAASSAASATDLHSGRYPELPGPVYGQPGRQPDGRYWKKCDCRGPVPAGQMVREFTEPNVADPASSGSRFCAIIASADPELLPPAVRDCFDTPASCRASFADGRRYYPGTKCVAVPSTLYCLDLGR